MGSSSDGLSPDGSTLTFGYDSETEEISPLRTFRSARSSPGRIFRTCRLPTNRTQAFEHEERTGVVCSIANNNPQKSKLSSLFDFSLVDSPQTAPQCRARRLLRSKLQIVATVDLRQILQQDSSASWPYERLRIPPMGSQHHYSQYWRFETHRATGS